MRTALFAGSFNPFTIGHKSIADRTLATLADRLIIGIGYNRDKHDPASLQERMETIRSIYSNDPRVEVRTYSSLTVEFARECGADFMVRGVRSVADFEYERSLADANLDLSGMETVLLLSLPQYSFISSSMVRELKAFGADVSKYLPQNPKHTE